MTKLFSALAAALVLSGAAAAQDGAIRVTLAAPVAQAGAVQGLATRWTCTGTTCIGPMGNARLGDARACREAAKAVGTVTAYEGPRGALGADDLAKCNKSAKPTA